MVLSNNLVVVPENAESMGEESITKIQVHVNPHHRKVGRLLTRDLDPGEDMLIKVALEKT